MSDGSRFDPRFDPAFQPGYDGPIRANREPGPELQGRSGVPRSMVEAPSRQASPTVSPAPTVAQQIPAQPGAAQPSATQRIVDDPDGSPPPRRANPFLIALGVIAVVLTAAGLFLITQLQGIYGNTATALDVDYTTVAILIAIAPLLIMTGIVTGIGVLFVFAARWRR